MQTKPQLSHALNVVVIDKSIESVLSLSTPDCQGFRQFLLLRNSSDPTFLLTRIFFVPDHFLSVGMLVRIQRTAPRPGRFRI